LIFFRESGEIELKVNTIKQIEIATQGNYILSLQFTYILKDGEIYKGIHMGSSELSKDAEIEILDIEDADKVLTIFSGRLNDHITFLKMTTLRSKVLSIGDDKFDPDIIYFERDLIANEFLRYPRTVFIGKYLNKAVEQKGFLVLSMIDFMIWKDEIDQSFYVENTNSNRK